MTLNRLNPPIVPRNGHTIKILSVRRVSCPGPGKQDIRSLDDQGALHEMWITEHIDQPYEIKVVQGVGSGEYLERAEYLELFDEIETGKWDLVITEDLGRIARRIESYLCCELCEDYQTRLISINDNVDTAQDNWEDSSLMASWHHIRSNRDLSARIKRTQRNRFLSGDLATIPIFGYRKKPGTKSDTDWGKIPEAEPIYKEWFDRLDKGASYSEVADWLNGLGVPIGPKCRKDKWDCAMVSAVTHNWLLKGIRYRNKRKSKRRRKGKGKYKSVKAEPEELLTRHVPHLAFFDEAYYDRVLAKVDKRNAMYSRTRNGGPDPCVNRPRNRTRFPGQTIYCGVCGRKFVFGAHGRTKYLMCSGAREHKCWNGATISGELTAKNISDAVFAEIEKLPGFDSTFLSLVNEEADLCLPVPALRRWQGGPVREIPASGSQPLARPTASRIASASPGSRAEGEPVRRFFLEQRFALLHQNVEQVRPLNITHKTTT